VGAPTGQRAVAADRKAVVITGRHGGKMDGRHINLAEAIVSPTGQRDLRLRPGRKRRRNLGRAIREFVSTGGRFYGSSHRKFLSRRRSADADVAVAFDPHRLRECAAGPITKGYVRGTVVGMHLQQAALNSKSVI